MHQRFQCAGIANRASAFATPGIANRAWAFATPGQLGVKLFDTLARAVELPFCDFNAQDLADTTWAFATLRQWDEELLAA